MNLVAVANEFAKPGQSVVCVKYFTARVKGDPEKNKRHSTYIDALRSTGRVEIIEGNFQLEPFYCSNCHNRRSVPKEKQTDTNIATSMVIDAFRDRWDVAFVVSGDADLAPPVRGVRHEFPKKPVFVVYPPSRMSSELRDAASSAFFINAAMLGRCQFADEIRVGDVVLKRPAKWE